MSLSAIIIAKNEERAIARAIKSVSFANEIIVVDAESADQTRDVAAAAGAVVLTNRWPGYGAQKNFGATRAHGDWLLFIDADEEVTPPLAAEIRRVVSTRPHTIDLYWLRIITIFLGRPLRHLTGHNPRLVRKDTAHWTDARVHEQVIRTDSTLAMLSDGRSALITEPLRHHSHQTIGQYLDAMHEYTSLDAEEMSRTGQHRSGRGVRSTTLLPFGLALRQFVKLLIYRHGWLDGWQGITWCVLSAYYEYEMGRKYLAMKK